MRKESTSRAAYSELFKRFAFAPRRKSKARLVGQFPSMRSGSGQEFHSLREYAVGDDSRKIDWHHFAKTGNLSVREDIAETNLRIMLLQDLSSSISFGAKAQELEIFFAFLRYLISDSNNAFATIGFDEKIRVFKKSASGSSAIGVLNRLSEMISNLDQRKIADLSLAVSALERFSTRQDIIFFASDFLLGDAASIKTELAKIALLQELIPVVVRDPREKLSYPNTRFRAMDMESGKIGNASYAKTQDNFDRELKDAFVGMNLDFLWLESDNPDDVLGLIVNWLNNRTKRTR